MHQRNGTHQHLDLLHLALLAVPEDVDGLPRSIHPGPSSVGLGLDLGLLPLGSLQKRIIFAWASRFFCEHGDFGRCTEPKLQVFCWRNDALLRAPSSRCVPRSHHHLPRPLARDPGRHGAQRQQRPVRPAGLGDGGGRARRFETLADPGKGMTDLLAP